MRSHHRRHIVRIPHVHTREPKLLVTFQPIKGLEFDGHNRWLAEAMKTLFLDFIVLTETPLPMYFIVLFTLCICLWLYTSLVSAEVRNYFQQQKPNFHKLRHLNFSLKNIFIC